MGVVRRPGASGGGVPGSAVRRHVMDPLERTVRTVLRAGIAVAVALMLFGVALALVRGDGLPAGVTMVAELPAGLAGFEPQAYLSLGIIVLIGTPFVRVAGALVVFARERDLRYALITGVVLVVMSASVLLGRV